MLKYFSKKLVVYLITFFLAVTINWVIPRFMPGNPILTLLAEFEGMEGAQEIVEGHLAEAFRLDQPLLTQYLNFWRSIFNGELGVSLRFYPRRVADLIKSSIWYDFILIFPALILSWIVGNKLGAFSGFNKKFDSTFMPIFYFLRAAPYFWFAVVTVYVLAFKLNLFPTSQAHSPGMTPAWNLSFILDFLHHWFLPFITMFLVELGGWAIGMRNMVIYEKQASYSRYMKELGASDKLVRSYAFRNGVLPQITGLAIRIGTSISGAVMVQNVFSYPGLGYRMLQAVQYNDYFVLQGCFLMLITMTLIANFSADVIYMFVDPRVRISYSEGE